MELHFGIVRAALAMFWPTLHPRACELTVIRAAHCAQANPTPKMHFKGEKKLFFSFRIVSETPDDMSGETAHSVTMADSDTYISCVIAGMQLQFVKHQ